MGARLMKLDDLTYEVVARNYDTLNRFPRNGWFYWGPLEIYVRAGDRYRQLAKTLQIANIVVNQRHRRKGWFKRALALSLQYAERNGFEAVVIENVLVPEFEESLRRKGWRVLPQPGWETLGPKTLFRYAQPKERIAA